MRSAAAQRTQQHIHDVAEPQAAVAAGGDVVAAPGTGSGDLQYPLRADRHRFRVADHARARARTAAGCVARGAVRQRPGREGARVRDAGRGGARTGSECGRERGIPRARNRIK